MSDYLNTPFSWSSLLSASVSFVAVTYSSSVNDPSRFKSAVLNKICSGSSITWAYSAYFFAISSVFLNSSKVSVESKPSSASSKMALMPSSVASGKFFLTSIVYSVRSSTPSLFVSIEVKRAYSGSANTPASSTRSFAFYSATLNSSKERSWLWSESKIVNTPLI